MLKSILAAMAALLTVNAFSADSDAILSKIEKTNEQYKTLKCDFNQTRSFKATGKEIYLQGVLCYSREDKMSMIYNDDREKLVINGAKFYLKRGNVDNTFNTDNNTLMRQLSGTLLGCVAGHPETVAKDYKADLSVAQSGNRYVVTIKATKDSPKKYSRIELYYRTTDCILVKMVMVEPAGITNTYDMSGIKKNVSIEESSFKASK